MLREVSFNTMRQELEANLELIPSDHELSLIKIDFINQIPLSKVLEANLTLRAEKVKVKAIYGAPFDVIQHVRPGE